MCPLKWHLKWVCRRAISFLLLIDRFIYGISAWWHSIKSFEIIFTRQIVPIAYIHTSKHTYAELVNSWVGKWGSAYASVFSIRSSSAPFVRVNLHNFRSIFSICKWKWLETLASRAPCSFCLQWHFMPARALLARAYI